MIISDLIIALPRALSPALFGQWLTKFLGLFLFSSAGFSVHRLFSSDKISVFKKSSNPIRNPDPPNSVPCIIDPNFNL